MDFHLPKPLHGWRAFVGEVGIIVMGVLIALGAEQLVQYFHQRAELRDAEDAMVSELRDDDLPQAFTRAAIINCYANQLDAIENAVAAGDRAKVLQLARAYQPINRTWDDEAWKAAQASQVLIHSGSKRMLAWANAYVMVPRLDDAAGQERSEVPKLYASLSGEGSLSAEQQDRLYGVISSLRAHNRRMSGASLVFIRFAAEQGLALTDQRKTTLLAEAQKTYGSCVAAPSPERINLNTQISIVNDAGVGRTQESPADKPPGD